MLRASFVLLAVLLFGLFRLDQLNKTPIHPENFSTYNAVEIYTLGVVMSALAYPVYPEIAKEHMALYVKNKEEKHSCFFMQSAYVRKKIANYIKPTMLSWHSSSYMFGNPEARVSLALNGAMLFKSGNVVWVDVPIKYPRNSLVKLLPFIEVQEGLFWILQQKRWYHTGTVRWICALNNA